MAFMTDIVNINAPRQQRVWMFCSTHQAVKGYSRWINERFSNEKFRIHFFTFMKNIPFWLFYSKKIFVSEQKTVPGCIQDLFLEWIKLGFNCRLQKYLRCDLPRLVNMA